MFIVLLKKGGNLFDENIIHNTVAIVAICCYSIKRTNIFIYYILHTTIEFINYINFSSLLSVLLIAIKY